MRTVCFSGIDLSWIRDLPERMAERGLAIGGPDADVHLVGDAPQPQRPHILLADCDAADFYDGPAKRLWHPYCIGAVKSYRLDKWNKPAIGGRHFATHLPGAKEEDAIPGNLPNKRVAAWLSYVHLPLMAPYEGIGREMIRAKTLGPKTVRAWFAGTTRYEDRSGVVGALITAHRQAVEHYGAKVDRDLYAHCLSRANVAISPWGWGEACWRDWEAILCGCSLVKPACPWVRSATGLYQSGRATWCRPDWSDLEECIENAANKTKRERMEDMQWAIGERAKAGEVVASAIAEIVA